MKVIQSPSLMYRSTKQSTQQCCAHIAHNASDCPSARYFSATSQMFIVRFSVGLGNLPRLDRAYFAFNTYAHRTPAI